MKIILAILALFVALSYADGECAVFACNSIDQEGETKVWGKRIDAEGDNPLSFHSQECPSEKFCQAGSWNNPDDAKGATASVNCGDTSTKKFPVDWTAPADNTLLDGDHCTTAAQCFASDPVTSDCVDSICKVSAGLDDPCNNDSKNCPIGHFCSGDNKCTALLGVGDTCVKDEECARGHNCIKIGEGEFTCTAYATLEEGAQFTLPATNSQPQGLKDATVGSSSVCKTGGQTTIGEVTQCRYQQRTVDQVHFVDNLQTKCKFNTYINEDLTKYNDATVDETVDPLCGFNSNSSAVCPMYPGDDKFLDLKAEVAKFVKDMNCHRLSGVSSFATGQVCQDYFLKKEEKEAFLAFRMGQVGTHQIWANTANNDQCTARTITFRNWNGFDSAYMSYGVVGMIATALTYIMM